MLTSLPIQMIEAVWLLSYRYPDILPFHNGDFTVHTSPIFDNVSDLACFPIFPFEHIRCFPLLKSGNLCIDFSTSIVNYKLSIMLLKSVISSLVLVVSVNAGVIDVGKLVEQPITRYFVEMKRPNTTERLCVLDEKVKATGEHIRDGISKVFSFNEFEGFSGHFTSDILQRMSKHPLISRITEDILVEATEFEDTEVQYNAPNHLVRLSQWGPVEEGENEYYYDGSYQGEGVINYVIDTGINTDLPEFEGRAILGPNFSFDAKNADYIGHGTHVAGIIGSATYGVAKKTTMMSIKVLDRFGQGSLSSVIAGIEYAVNHRKENDALGVANLSLGAARSPILNNAVRAAYESGLFVVSAAGNSNVDACLTSPGGSPYAYTVGAIDDSKDTIAAFSNYGSCVNIFAPGVNVDSLSNDPEVDSIKMSGTSMASPIVCGLAAIELGKGTPMDEIPQVLKDDAVSGAIPKISILIRPGSSNKVATNGYMNNAHHDSVEGPYHDGDQSDVVDSVEI
ncbi:unnamed protein product [Ambrosiozyma monospora]|uniref:Unnamed protein product n=1 Tax=Ambrosiozyma monospora TaxID=43982 RepID=A0A9W6Z632_AMBMO|nr:unnamed protein product [Ambrosiozyma monospora]